MRLERLVLDNFQAIGHIEIVPAGKDITIYGANGAGKTTVANAISWLLTDAPANGEKNWTPKTVDENGEDTHCLDHRAEATFLLDDGEMLCLAKNYHEVYTKKRGTTEKELTGNTTECFINGKAVSATSYANRLEEICPRKQMMILTLPHYFAQTMDWRERRDILISLYGDVSDEDVFSGDEELKELEERLVDPASGRRRSIDAFREIMKDHMDKVKKDLDEIPARIDEAQHTINEIPTTCNVDDLGSYDEETVAHETAELERQKNELIARKASLKEDDATIQAKDRLARLKMKYNERRAAWTENEDEKNREVKEQIRQRSLERGRLSATLSEMRPRMRSLNTDIGYMEKTREENKARYEAEAARVFDEPEETVSTECPYCHQPLPPERIEESRKLMAKVRQEHLEAFEAQKQKRLDEIVKASASCSKKAIDAASAKLARMREEIDAADARIAQLDEEMGSLKSRLVETTPFEDTETAIAMKAEMESLKDAVAGGGDLMDEARSAIENDIGDIDARLRVLGSITYAFQLKRRQEERIAELKAQLGDVQTDMDETGRMLDLVKRFISRKLSMLDRKVNSHFENVTFILSDNYINGGFTETCEPRIRTATGAMIDYSKASNAEKINAGLDIIDTLSKAWGLSMPIVIDNAEAICDIRGTGSQQIRLVVSRDDRKLRMLSA